MSEFTFVPSNPSKNLAPLSQKSSQEVIQYILENKIFIACKLGGFEILRSMISSSQEVEITDENGQTPLIISVLSQQPKVVEFLLSLPGIDLQREWKSKVALEHAQEQKFSELVDMIRKKRAEQLQNHVKEKTAKYREFIFRETDSPILNEVLEHNGIEDLEYIFFLFLRRREKNITQLFSFYSKNITHKKKSDNIIK